MKKYWRSLKQLKFKLLSSIISNPTDIRPYARVTVFDEQVDGLLDTGASISCVGNALAERILQMNIPFKKMSSTVRTADGKQQKIVGSLKTLIKFKGIENSIELFIIPSLSQSLYLGIDFWKSLNILPDFSLFSISDTEFKEKNQEAKFCKLDAAQKSSLQDVIKLFPSFAKEGLGKTKLIAHSIDVGNCRPIKQRHYPVSPVIEKMIYEELDRMLNLGVIEESLSPWSSPVVLVRKPGKNRLCLDSRKVNMVTVKDAYPLPFIDGILSRLPKAKFITGLDLKDAFWQISLDAESKEKTAFTVPGRPLYQFTIMAFGLCNAPQTMSSLMDKVIPNELKTEVFVYLDDLLIVSNEFVHHLEVLKLIAKRFRETGLTINVEKRTKRKFLWTSEAQKAFDVLKTKLSTAPVLHSPDFSMNEEGDELPIAFMSKKLNKAQRNYTVTEQECLAASDWSLKLQAFNFKIIHRKDHEIFVDLESPYFESNEYLNLIKEFQENLSSFPDIKITEGRIYRRSNSIHNDALHDEFSWKLWLPREMTNEALWRAHADCLAAHAGMNKTLENLRKYYYWSGMVISVRDFINSCEACKVNKHPNQILRPPMGKMADTDRFLERLYVDFVGPYPRSRRGNIGILVVLDQFSKFPFIKPVKRLNTEVAYQKNWDEELSGIACALRSSIHSATGKEPYYVVFGQHMVTNGKAYSLSRKLKLLDDHSLRLSREDSVQLTSRLTKHRRAKQFNRNEKSYNLRSTVVNFVEGQEVNRRNFKQSSFVKCYNAKLEPVFVKARIRKKIGNSCYELEDLQGNVVGIYHAKDIKQ
ncbi:uncharacterized protein K02A2.6-like [Glossina fuscipes]|uniref:RNA-directed DNA polymerase n=1 Tax=Glossina fuscipes TaxID=7396 RepID=A0A9C6E3N4_9MUSC|nr:uncharacterized protein K02A2.6-like [Glossina fuscipes]